MSSPTENPLVQITLCLVACYIVVQIFSPSPSPSSVSAPSLPSPPPSAILANDLDHLNEAAHLPSSPSPGDLAAYNFFCHDPSSLVESIRSGTRPASAQVAHENSVAFWGKALPVPPLIVLVSVRLAQLERSYPYLLARPALERVWAVAGFEATKEDMAAALCGKLEGLGSAADSKRGAGGSQGDIDDELNVKKALEEINAKMDRISEALKLDRPLGP